MSSPKSDPQESPIVMAENGEPFPDKDALKAAMKKKGIARYEIIKLEGGFAAKIPLYWRVKFQAKASPNDTPDVVLVVNGDTLICKREVETIIPDRYKECADNGTYQQWEQKPGETRKVIARIKIYNYDLIGPASEKEYFDFLNKGTKHTKEIIEKFGHDYVPPA